MRVFLELFGGRMARGRRRADRFVLVAAAFLIPLLGGCAHRPEGESDERDLAAEIGKPYELPFDEREIPSLSPDPTWQDVLRRAFLTNGKLEGAYWEWRAALERIPQESSNTFTPAAFFSYMLKAEGDPTAWDRTTLGLQNDPMSNIELPMKPAARGRRALEESRAAFRRFELTKFEIQAEVLKTWYEWCLLAEMIRYQEAIVVAHASIARSEEAQYRSGLTSQTMLLEHHNTLELAESDLDRVRTRIPELRARLNALLGRSPGDSLNLPRSLPVARSFPYRDDQFLALVAEKNPEVLELAQEVKGREEALKIAQQKAIPDFGLNAALTGNVSAMIGGMLTLPFLKRAEIDGAVEEARAGLLAMQSWRRQKAEDVRAGAVADLVMLRYAENRIDLFSGPILERARMAESARRAEYEGGRAMLADWLETQIEVLDAERMLAELRVERESRLADLERMAAVDVDSTVVAQ